MVLARRRGRRRAGRRSDLATRATTKSRPGRAAAVPAARSSWITRSASATHCSSACSGRSWPSCSCWRHGTGPCRRRRRPRPPRGARPGAAKQGCRGRARPTPPTMPPPPRPRRRVAPSAASAAGSSSGRSRHRLAHFSCPVGLSGGCRGVGRQAGGCQVSVGLAGTLSGHASTSGALVRTESARERLSLKPWARGCRQGAGFASRLRKGACHGGIVRGRARWAGGRRRGAEPVASPAAGHTGWATWAVAALPPPAGNGALDARGDGDHGDRLSRAGRLQGPSKRRTAVRPAA